MQQIFIRLSVFHNGQFFEALFERWDQQGYSAAKKLFAVEPSPPQIFQMVLCELPEFSKPVKTSVQPSAIDGNPKRRQREASKEAKGRRHRPKPSWHCKMRGRKKDLRCSGVTEKTKSAKMIFALSSG